MFFQGHVKRFRFSMILLCLEVNYFEMQCVTDLNEMLDKLYEDTLAYDNY